MESTIIQMGNSLGIKVPDAVIKNYNLKVGTIIEMNFQQGRDIVFRKKRKVREGWSAAFAQYANEGEDKLRIPDYIDSETDK